MTTTTRIWYTSPSGAKVGSEEYYTEAMAAKYYGVDDETGRAFRVFEDEAPLFKEPNIWSPQIETRPVPVTVKPVETYKVVTNPLKERAPIRAELDGIIVEGWVDNQYNHDSTTLTVRKTVWRNHHAIGDLAFRIDLTLPWKITVLDSFKDFASKNG